jgi:hypothetical protein
VEFQLKKRRLGSHYLVVIGDPIINKRRLGSDKPVVVGNPINKKEIRIPLTGCHWRSN